MSLGLSGRFQILQQSPYDFQPLEPERQPDPEALRWIPSRYNIRATTPDDRLVLWNSYKGTMTVFAAAQKPAIEALLSRKGFEARREGIVQYLFKRGFLVKEGTDEFRRIQLGFGQQQYRTDVLQLILLASEDCNLRCQYCYEDFARGTMQPAVRRGIKNLVQKRLSGLRSLSVSWFGGEPLYGFAAIEELAPFFLATAEEHGLQYFTHMTTNGYLLTPEVAEKLLAWKINTFQITLDGAPEDHDRSRPARDGQGSFAVILENLRALSRRPESFFVDMRVNFDRRNQPGLGRFLDLIETHFRDDPRFKLRFRAVGQWGGPNDAELDVCGHDESADVVRRMKAEASKRGISLSDDIRHVQGLGAQVCYAARPYNFIVGASGKLMKCTIDLDRYDRNVVGQLSEEGDMDLDVDKLALWTEPAFEHDTKCQKCVVLPACQGVFCPQIRMDTGQSPCSPLRMGAKAELLDTVAASDLKARRVTVPAGAAQHRDGSAPE
jgi:uncharacterized protein